MSQTVRTICSYCHANCGMLVQVDGEKMTRVKGDPDHPSSRGYLCKQGLHGNIPIVYHKERLKAPLLRTAKGFQKVSWEEALGFAADRLLSLREKYGSTILVREMGAPYTYEGGTRFFSSWAPSGPT